MCIFSIVGRLGIFNEQFMLLDDLQPLCVIHPRVLFVITSTARRLVDRMQQHRGYLYTRLCQMRLFGVVISSCSSSCVCDILGTTIGFALYLYWLVWTTFIPRVFRVELLLPFCYIR